MHCPQRRYDISAIRRIHSQNWSRNDEADVFSEISSERIERECILRMHVIYIYDRICSECMGYFLRTYTQGVPRVFSECRKYIPGIGIKNIAESLPYRNPEEFLVDRLSRRVSAYPPDANRKEPRVLGGGLQRISSIAHRTWLVIGTNFY